MSEARYLVGDVFDRMAELPDGSVDLIVTSPPFLALRSYLPAGHPDKGKEIGSEATPAAFLSTLLALTREWRRLLAPHGSICVELGDTYSGSGGAGGDYGAGGLREGQGKFDGSGRRNRPADVAAGILAPTKRPGPEGRDKIAGWPLAKSLCLLPTLYPASLAYGRNLLDPDDTLDPWRIRNLIVWHRPNPPVGALGDKVRPSTSYVTVACTSRTRWFDLDAERGPAVQPEVVRVGTASASRGINGGDSGNPDKERMSANPAGAPPLDCWTIPTAPYAGSHYATWPAALCRRLIRLMCPRLVCEDCGRPVVESSHDSTSLPGMRIGDISSVGDATKSTTSDPVLFEDLRKPAHRTQQSHNEGMGARSEGLHTALSARSSDGVEVGLRNGTSAHRGGSARPNAGSERSGASRQRQEGRQPPRESGSDAEDGTRPETETPRLAHDGVSALRRDDSGTQPCAHCGSRNLRRGRVLDPFAGSGTTLMAASELGRDSIGIDLDERNLDLARERCGMFLVEAP